MKFFLLMRFVFTADYDDDDDDGVIDVSVTSSRNHGDGDVRDHQWRHSARHHHDNDQGFWFFTGSFFVDNMGFPENFCVKLAAVRRDQGGCSLS